MGFLWTNQKQVEEPKVGRAEGAHKLLVEAKMDYNKCVSEIETEIAKHFSKLFKSPVDIKYRGSKSTYMADSSYTLFDIGDLRWRMYSYNPSYEDKTYHSFEVQVEDKWKSIKRPADLWIALGYGE